MPNNSRVGYVCLSLSGMVICDLWLFSNNYSIPVWYIWSMSSKSSYQKYPLLIHLWIFISERRSQPKSKVLSLFMYREQARKLQATLEGCNPKLWITDWLTDSLTGVKCRATSVAKNQFWKISLCIKPLLQYQCFWKQLTQTHRAKKCNKLQQIFF